MIEKIKLIGRKKNSDESWRELNIPVKDVEDAREQIANQSDIIRNNLDLAIRVTTIIT